MQTGTHLLLRVTCDVMWCMPDRSPSFEVSALFPLREIKDIFANATGREYDVQKLIFYCLMANKDFICGYNHFSIMLQ